MLKSFLLNIKTPCMFTMSKMVKSKSIISIIFSIYFLLEHLSHTSTRVHTHTHTRTHTHTLTHTRTGINWLMHTTFIASRFLWKSPWTRWKDNWHHFAEWCRNRLNFSHFHGGDCSNGPPSLTLEPLITITAQWTICKTATPQASPKLGRAKAIELSCTSAFLSKNKRCSDLKWLITLILLLWLWMINNNLVMLSVVERERERERERLGRKRWVRRESLIIEKDWDGSERGGESEFKNR